MILISLPLCIWPRACAVFVCDLGWRVECLRGCIDVSWNCSVCVCRSLIHIQGSILATTFLADRMNSGNLSNCNFSWNVHRAEICRTQNP